MSQQASSSWWTPTRSEVQLSLGRWLASRTDLGMSLSEGFSQLTERDGDACPGLSKSLDSEQAPVSVRRGHSLMQVPPVA